MWSIGLAAGCAALWGGEPPTSFERDVRPIFKTHCFHCHGESEEVEAGLDLRLRRWIVAGGDSGPAIVPGDVEASLLWQRLVDGEMPPEDVAVRPTAEELERIRRWIAAGAPVLREEPEFLPRGFVITEQDRSHWAFQSPQRPAVPDVASPAATQTPVDRFVVARLESSGLRLQDEAARHHLLRRLSIDLTGLPPTPEMVIGFEQDERPDALDRRVDQLLASPAYGQRWARHWLDVAGYADSEGVSDEDPPRPDAYKYRDYVIRSLNDGKPLDQFICEQLAGDEMVQPPYSQLSGEALDRLIATGFLRMAPDGTVAQNTIAARNQMVADTLQIVGSALLGLTVHCAQCHHHRYDPISQQDYYRWRAIFDPALSLGRWQVPAQRRVAIYSQADQQRAAAIEEQARQLQQRREARQAELIEAVFQRELAKVPEADREAVRAARNTPESKRTDQQRALLRRYPSVNVSAGSLYLYDRRAADELKKMADEIAALRATKPAKSYVRALTEPLDTPPPASHLMQRGDPEQPGEVVHPGELSILAGPQCQIPIDDPQLPTTGRRLAYARWLTSGRHPLTARVLVNRIWLHLFGRGLVSTPSDFGHLGDVPSHPQLLDWLAVRLVDTGWDMKRVQRMLVLSAVYRQSSACDGRTLEQDPDNRFLSRMALRRLDAESLRDSMLAIAGLLNCKMYGPPVPVMADRVGRIIIGKENLNAGRPGPYVPMRGEEFRHTIYVEVRRSRPLSFLAAFDAPRMEPNCPLRSSSTVAPQALTLMNGDLMRELSLAAAQSIVRESGADERDCVRLAWWRCYGRPPQQEELQLGVAFVREQREWFAQRPWEKPKPANGERPPAWVGDPQIEALGELVHVLLSSNEFLYIP